MDEIVLNLENQKLEITYNFTQSEGVLVSIYTGHRKDFYNGSFQLRNNDEMIQLRDALNKIIGD